MDPVLNNHHIFQIFKIYFLTIISVSVFAESAPGANRSVPNRITQNKITQNRISVNHITTIENRLRPFLENRVQQRTFSRYSPQPHPQYHDFTQSDFFALPRVWNDLSSEFKQLYRQASQIPSWFQKYESPGGFFEIFFTIDTNSSDCVDTTDNYGYNKENWRSKSELPNGVPDYIDEVAWALDSTYNAEITGFGFVEPIPFKSEKHTSNKYKVVVEHYRNSGDYGLTYVFPEQRGTDGGFASYITLRNHWPSSEWSQLGYDKNPQFGVRVTCAHEFFHAVQYAMCRNLNGATYLDDFPLSWIEGTATSMEELLFGDINDYIQYANIFFSYPDYSLLSRTSTLSGSFDYSNSLLVLYLCYNTLPTPGIDFIYQIFDNNYKNPLPFFSNLEQTSKNLGYEWVKLLNNFHTASFFSGIRADTTRFIPDANLLMQWSYNFSKSSSITKTVNPYAMAKVFIRSIDFQTDTLIIHLSSLDDSKETDNKWAASVLFRKVSGDSIISVPLSSQGNGLLILPDWNRGIEAGVVVTNGDPDLKKEFNISFEYGRVNIASGEKSIQKFLSPDLQSFADIFIEAQSDLRCSLAVSTESSSFLTQMAKAQSLSSLSTLFTIDYPEFWNEKSRIELAIGTFAQNRVSVPDSTDLYIYQESDSSWKIIETNFFIRNDTLFAAPIVLSRPGVYGIFSKCRLTKNDLAVYPNPFSLRKNNDYIIFDGVDIKDVVIFDMNGNLVQKITPNTTDAASYQAGNSNILKWDLKNRSGKVIIPGLYVATVSCYDNLKTKTLRRKLLVVP